jgi:hypothetical protein
LENTKLKAETLIPNHGPTEMRGIPDHGPKGRQNLAQG